WLSPPFEPEVRDGKLFGRGACDDKAGVLTAVQAVEAYLAAGAKPPVNVTFLVEGEEEIGSPNLAPVLREHAELLKADLAVCADAQGRVVVEGFEAGVPPLAPEVRRAIAALPLDEAAELRQLGLSEWWGDPDYTPEERRTVRPTLEVNGIGGGYQGAGVKTVLPNRAFAKITCRLVVGQEPEAVFRAIERHVERHTPPGVRATLTLLPGSGRPYQMPLDHPALAVAADAMSAVFGRSPFPVWTGGTVPVAEQF